MAKMETRMESARIESVLARYRPRISRELRRMVRSAASLTPSSPATAERLNDFYAQIEYHLGWRHPDLSEAKAHPGKLLRPTLLLLACALGAELRGADESERAASVEAALPAAACVELVHNFSLIHDDIEDGDETRRHRPTLWTLWGVPQAINTGDGLFSLARAGLWELPARGVAPAVVVRLADRLDRTCLELCEGQYLDMSFEGRDDVTVEMYLDMIGRKTAALMACATTMGALIGAPEDDALVERMERFGRALGVAFQLRDDLLGIWAPTSELGKAAAGDLRRKKVTLPIIHAREVASPEDRAAITSAYTGAGAMPQEQIETTLRILERAGAREHAREELRARAADARTELEALGEVGNAERDGPREALASLLRFVSAAAE